MKLFDFIYDCSRKSHVGVFLLRFIYGYEIPRETQIGNNVQFVHRGLGVVINPLSIIEDNVRIQHHVTLGVKENGHTVKAPIIKKNAFIGANAIILGGVTIGENAVIGAGSIVLHDVPDNTVYVNKINK